MGCFVGIMSNRQNPIEFISPAQVRAELGLKRTSHKQEVQANLVNLMHLSYDALTFFTHPAHEDHCDALLLAYISVVRQFRKIRGLLDAKVSN